MQRKAYSGRYGLRLEVCSNTWNRLGGIMLVSLHII